MTLAGAVLVGGSSTRMQRDKAGLQLGEETLLTRQLRILRESGAAPLFIVGRPDHRYEEPGAAFVSDDPTGHGPIAGIMAALAASPAAHVAILAVDLPVMEPEFFRQLAKFCGMASGAVVRTGEGFEPLAAIYHRSCLSDLVAWARAGRNDLQGFLESAVENGSMQSRPVPAAMAGMLLNWNHPEDYARMQQKAGEKNGAGGR
jgi:molybdopterin-guanine dinucleotide biosynthesis protein A